MSRRRKRKPLPPDPIQVTIEDLSHEGRGIAHLDGKTIFIDNALPGETVLFRYTALHGRFDEGEAIEIQHASDKRVEPKCPHFGVCGGCSLQHLHPESQIALKQKTLLEQFQHVGQVTPENILPPLTGPIWSYRHKARLGVKYVEKKGGALVGFREKRSPYVTEIQSCVVLQDAVGQRIMALRELISGLEAKLRIAQIEVAIGEDNTALVLRNLDPLSKSDTDKLIAFAQDTGLQLYLQSGGPKTVTPLYPKEPDNLHYHLPLDLDLAFQPNDFTQVNPSINRKMIQRALEFLEPQEKDHILELFCGLGNFTLPLATHAEHIMAVEGEASLVERAEQNARRYGLKNVQYAVANLMEVQKDADWLRGNYNKILLDPPRSGAIEIIQQLNFANVERILYISCNPATLARDAGELVNQQGFKLKQAGVMDMFPHTAHVESIALFER